MAGLKNVIISESGTFYDRMHFFRIGLLQKVKNHKLKASLVNLKTVGVIFSRNKSPAASQWKFL